MPRAPIRRTTHSLLLAATLLVGPLAFAQQVDEGSKSAARQVGKEGLAAYKAGRYDEALAKLSRAYAVVKVPALGLWTARALEKTGKLVEASELYHEVGLLQAVGGDAEVQAQAKQEAAEEREKLQARIPKLTVEVQGAPAEQVKVKIDGVEVPPALVGMERPVNPGEHQVVGVWGDQSATEAVLLAASESKAVVLRFAAEATSAAGAPAAPPAAGPGPAGPPSDAAAVDSGTDAGSTQRLLGWVGIGVGSAGLLFSTVTGVIALSQRGELDDGGCVDGVCYDDQLDDVDSYNTMRTLSTIGFVIGAAGVSVGAVLLLTAPTQEQTAALQPWVGIGSAGVRGRF